MAISTMNTQQLVLLISGFVGAFALATIWLGPLILETYPKLWYNIPFYFLAGVAVWAASHRPGAAAATHFLVGSVILLFTKVFGLNYFIGLLVGGIGMDLGLL